MARHRVLIVEDEQDIAGLIKHTLERGGETEAQIVGSGDAALKAVTERVPDLIILDLNLPVISGLEVCRILRSRADVPHVPIIMLTARTSEDDRVAGPRTGRRRLRHQAVQPARADRARARGAAARPRPRAAPAARYQGDRLTADFDAVAIAVDGAPVRLTRREFELLQYLVQNKNRVVSRDRLLERVWGYERLVETRSVDVHVGRLRSKLRTAGRQIETVVGLGYRFVD